MFWEATSTDAWGHIQDESFGNGVKTFTDFDQANGWMEARQGGIGGGTGLLDALVNWDKNGNLTERVDLKQSGTCSGAGYSAKLCETFVYDSLNRFDSSQRNGTTNQDVTLNAIGNITWKLGIGSYTYHATKKRAVIGAGGVSYGYDNNGNMTTRAIGSVTDTITYTSYNLPSLINSGTNSSALSSGAFRNRYKQVAVTSGTTETTIYVAGLLEKVTRDGVSEFRHRIYGAHGVAAIYMRRTAGSPLTTKRYVHTDHLGSPELITDGSGVQVVKLSFGAYGERRHADWSGPVSASDQTTIGNTWRGGFTGHEHLDAVDLIHMNGRVYDPVVARFLSVDPFVRVGLSQSPNSYSYVRNNPLTLVDPSGYLEGPRREACGGIRCTEGRGDVGGGGWDPSPGTFDRFNPRIRVIPGCRQCTPPASPGGEDDDPDPDAVPSASMPMARPLAVFTGTLLDNARDRLRVLAHYAGESLIGALDSILETAYSTQPINPTAGVDESAAELLGPYQSPFPAAETIEDQLARDLGESGAVLAGILTGKPFAARAGAQNAANAAKLSRQLGSQEGVGELLSGGGQAIAGAGTRVPLRDAGRLVSEYGGKVGDWAKVTSTAPGHLHTHAYRNVVTGEVVELKSIVP